METKSSTRPDHPGMPREDVAALERWPAGRKLLAARRALIEAHGADPADIEVTFVLASAPASVTTSAAGIRLRQSSTDGGMPVWHHLDWDQGAFVWRHLRGTVPVATIQASTPFLASVDDGDAVYGGKVASYLAEAAGLPAVSAPAQP